MIFDGTLASVCDYLQITPAFSDNVRALISRIKVTNIVCDSRKVTKGSIFYAKKGSHYDPFSHLDEIKAKGAVAILIDAPEVFREASNKGLLDPNLSLKYAGIAEEPNIDEQTRKREYEHRVRAGRNVILDYIKDEAASLRDYQATSNSPEAKAIAAVKMMRLVLPAHKSLGALASFIYGNPSQHMRVIGITGTNGKSTIASLIAQMLDACGHKTVFFGTVGYGFINDLQHANNTTLDAVTLQQELDHYRKLGADYAVMEVSSIGFCEGRVEGVSFYAGAFTNLTRDHLDYHKSMEDYFSAKLNFLRLIPQARIAINLNHDSGRRMSDSLPNCFEVFLEREKTTKNNLTSALNLKRIKYQSNGLELFLETSENHTMRTEVNLLGYFNAENFAVALGVMISMGYDYKHLMRLSPQLKPVIGRMETFTKDGFPRLIVDYAHTPDGVEQALRAAQSHTLNGGRIFTILGCGGDRDPGKRQMMALKASVFSDYVVFTADNPRSEPLNKILDDMMLAVDMPPVQPAIEAREEAERNADTKNKSIVEMAKCLTGDELKERLAQRTRAVKHLTKLKTTNDKALLKLQERLQKQQELASKGNEKAVLEVSSLKQQLQQKTNIKALLEQSDIKALVDMEISVDPGMGVPVLLTQDFALSEDFEAARQEQDQFLVNTAPHGNYYHIHPALVGLPLGLPQLTQNQRNVVVIADRYQAIRFAFEHAKKNDCVVIAGKGHEDYQIFAHCTTHFSDREVCCELLGLPAPKGVTRPEDTSAKPVHTPETPEDQETAAAAEEAATAAAADADADAMAMVAANTKSAKSAEGKAKTTRTRKRKEPTAAAETGESKPRKTSTRKRKEE